ncbi:MAG: hypothetical protein V9G29_03065 [Burkholderiaceae bacterium]
MRIETLGGWLIGAVLLATGLAVLTSDIDPAVLCFKQCEFPKAVQALFGFAFLRGATGLFFVSLGLLFIVPLIRKAKGKAA